MSQKTAGVLFVLAASLMWALETVCAKLAYRSSDYLLTLFVRCTVACGIALLYAGFRTPRRLKVPARKMPPLLYICFASTVLADLLYYYALTRIPVVNAVLVAHLQPVFLALLGLTTFHRERLTGHDFAGIAIMIMAGLWVTTGSLDNLFALRLGTLGDLWVLCATFLWATTAIAIKRSLNDLPAGVLSFYRFLFALPVFAGALLALGQPLRPNAYQWATGVIVGVGFIFYYEGLTRIKAAQASALELSTPFFAGVLGFAVLGEKVAPLQIAGIALIFGGVYFLSMKERLPADHKPL